MIELVAEPWLECTRRGAPQGGLGKIRNRTVLATAAVKRLGAVESHATHQSAIEPSNIRAVGMIKRRTKRLSAKRSASNLANFVAQAEDTANGTQWLHSETLISLKTILSSLEVHSQKS